MLEDSPLWEAIELWGELTGVKAPTQENALFSGSFGNYDIFKTYEGLKEALALDPTEITATLLFKTYIKDWLSRASTSMLELIDDPTAHIEQLTKAKRLLAIVDRPEIVEARDAFVEQLRQGLAAYDAAEREDVKALLAKPDAIAILRRDALRSVERLRVDQFLDGAPEDKSVKPIYVNHIHQWWNINSLLSTMTATPSGVSLNLIRDPNAYDTFFAFALRNGASLFVLSDVAKHAHPLAAAMYRKPGRDMEERIGKNWFPYELLNVAFDDKEGAYFEASDSKAIVPRQEEAVRIVKIGEVGAAETIWITMMLDLIVRKFWGAGYKPAELSYTGEMIRAETTLIDDAQFARLPVVPQTLALPQLTLADVKMSPDVVTDKEAYGRQKDRRNQWLEDRYADRVPEATLNLLEAPGKRMALTDTGEIVHYTKEMAEKHKDDLFFRRKTQGLVAMEPMAATAFGPRKQLEADRKFLARANYADQIAAMADAEFKARQEEIETWYKAKVRANAARLAAFWGLGETWIDVSDSENGNYDGRTGSEHTRGEASFDMRPGGTPGRQNYRTFLRHFDLTIPYKKMDLHESMQRYCKVSLGGYEHVRKDTCAVLDGVKASRLMMIYPATPEDIAFLTNTPVDQLPDVLQHWNLRDGGYYGNPILDRVDPMLWKVRNPWKKLDLRIRVPLSLRAIARLEKSTPTPLPAHLTRIYKTPDGWVPTPTLPQGTP